jgi:hypothetical protein
VTVEVRFADPEPSGLAELVGGLLRQNLARDPSRERLLRPCVVTIDASDAGVAITVRIGPGRVLVGEGANPRAPLAVTTDSARLLALTAVPLRFGFPDLFAAPGRAIYADLAARRIRIRGLVSHPVRLARLTMLLSVR